MLVFDGRGDYGPFATTGIPVGALCTGNEEIKSPEQAAKWGGQAGQAFDPNYHSSGDDLANVNRAALDVTGPAVAYVVGLYASDQAGSYALPSRRDRTRRLLEQGCAGSCSPRHSFWRGSGRRVPWRRISFTHY
jgi:Zn-dependent M28 family amino/carboxypeptidase